MLLQIAAAVNDLLSLTRALKTFSSRNGPSWKPAVKALRQIYFAPDGLKSLLHVIAEGEEPTEEQLAEALTRFNDLEPAIVNLYERASTQFPGEWPELSIKQNRMLRQILDQKMDVRATLQFGLNVDWFNNSPLTPSEAKALLAKIEELNCAIEELEDQVFRQGN